MKLHFPLLNPPPLPPTPLLPLLQGNRSMSSASQLLFPVLKKSVSIFTTIPKSLFFRQIRVCGCRASRAGFICFSLPPFPWLPSVKILFSEVFTFSSVFIRVHLWLSFFFFKEFHGWLWRQPRCVHLWFSSPSLPAADKKHPCVSWTNRYSNSRPSDHRSPRKHPNTGAHAQRTTAGSPHAPPKADHRDRSGP
jgi:hypothetical protein